MKNLKIYNFFISIWFLTLGLVLSGCVDDHLIDENSQSNNETPKGSYIEFGVSLSSMTRESSSSTGMADFEKYEDYVDPKNVRILFFYAEGDDKDKLFKAFDTNEDENLSFIPINSSTIGGSQEWYIRIPMDYNDDFSKTLREKKFKIAILANWGWDSDFTSDNIEFSPGDPIKKLHHLSNPDMDPYSNSVYSFLYEGYGGKMGVYQDWVEETFDRVGAFNWIRQNWYPGFPISRIEETCGEGFNYVNMRLLWNFNGVVTQNPSDFGDNNRLNWKDANTEDLKDWLINTEDSNYPPKTVLGDLQPIVERCNFEFIANGDKTKQEGDSGEESEGDGNNDGTTEEDNYINSTFEKIGDTYGVVLAPGKYVVTNNTTINRENVFNLELKASGKLMIKWSSNEDNKEAQLAIERRNYRNDSKSKENEEDFGMFHPTTKSTDIQILTYSYDINTEPEIVSLYNCTTDENGKGRPVIYEIEYVEDKHLAQTARRGKKLGIGIGTEELMLIPMYGIQVFDKLTNWEEGTVYGLSNFNQITPISPPKKVSLIRSVAKVELKLPHLSENDNYHHVFLRCMNRTSRAEPMDVSTPTDEIWKDNNSDGSHNTECEWFTLKNQTPFYQKNSTGTSTSYKQKLGWYYGTWASNYQLGTVTIEQPNNYPHILNPMMNRSDFAQFIYTGQDGIYDRYIIYVPEKFTDDPGTVDDSKDMRTQTPKVCHIEFRDPDDDFKNFDDDHCYRIYFTQGGIGDKKYFPNLSQTNETTNPTWENTYEQNIDNLKQHWPIMRNHVYSFTVIDAKSRILVLELKVLPWKEVDQNIYKW